MNERDYKLNDAVYEVLHIRHTIRNLMQPRPAIEGKGKGRGKGDRNNEISSTRVAKDRTNDRNNLERNQTNGEKKGDRKGKGKWGQKQERSRVHMEFSTQTMRRIPQIITCFGIQSVIRPMRSPSRVYHRVQHAGVNGRPAR